MKCKHDDCFTCPYPDCIVGSGMAYTDPVKLEASRQKRCGRKPLSPEEKARRKQEYNRLYNQTHREELRKKYLEKTEGKVKRRYKV